MLKKLQRSEGVIDLKILDNEVQKLFQKGSSKVLIPNSYNKNKEFVLINTSGGTTCNDIIKTNIKIENSKTSITTQAAEKIYAGVGDPAHIDVNISVKNSDINWLPKELILFNSSKLKRNININLDKCSNLFLCETLILGRKAMSEEINNLFFLDHWIVNIDNKIKHFESININQYTHQTFNNKFSINKNSAFSTILIFGYIVDQIKDDLIKIIKKITNIYCEISTWNNKIVIRCLANDNYDLKKTLNYILENIIHDKVPNSWYL